MKKKIAIPTSDGLLDAHFGHCSQFALVEVEDGEIRHIVYMDAPPHQPGLLPNWLSEKGVIAWAQTIRTEFLTGTALTIIAVLLILLVSPRAKTGGLVRRCPVCDHRLIGKVNYCGECGGKV